MTDVLLREALLRRGYTGDDLERLRRTGQLTRVRRGAYAWTDGNELSTENRHRRLLMATVPQLRVAAVVSHGSAAVLHGLPVWAQAVAQVHLTRPRVGGGKDRPLLRLHSCDLPGEDIVLLDGIAATSLARTVADLARTLPLDQATAAGDVALRHGLRRPDLQEVVQRCRRWPGAARARLVLELLDARSESVRESVSRVRMHETGLPAPELQYEVRDDDGTLVGRTDFAWERLGVLGEFDGRVKYGRLLAPGQDAADAVYREKLREDAMRDRGWRMVGWTWPDLHPGDRMVGRLARALGSA